MSRLAASGALGRWSTMVMYGLVLAAVVATLKYVEYRFMVKSLSTEVYIGVVAALFTGVGLWLGSKLIADKKVVEVVPATLVDEQAVRTSGLSARELEVLQLMAEGLSNQEIADKLFVSLPTVKSHSSSLFTKLEVKRRTEAVHRAKSLRIIA
ncbi:MAG: response regulator transcription factor [Flavobacteriales bacterium]|nr:response regulator transcription factor [Flavobacteriales bacterium]